MKKILIIEDDTYLRNALRETLEAEGYIVDSTDNGKTAIEKIENTYFDLIYTGIMMPVMDGLEFLKYLHKHKDSTKHGKIVVFSAIKHPEVVKISKKLGADDYIFLDAVTMEQCKNKIIELLGDTAKKYE